RYNRRNDKILRFNVGIIFQILMEISGDYSTPYARVTPKYHTRLQGIEPQLGKRRLSQARHRATLAGLFNNLRETVFSQQENSMFFLLPTEVLNLEDGNPSSLEDVKEEYVKMYFNNHRLQNLNFLKQTVDLLVDNAVVSPEEVMLPVVSTAVSHLWQGLPEDRKDSVLHYCSQRQNSISEIKTASQEPACTDESSVRDSGTNSQEASGSVVSTPEEVRIGDGIIISKTPGNTMAKLAISIDLDNNSQKWFKKQLKFFKKDFSRVNKIVTKATYII
uniref:Stimulated by retinoic acid 8 n=1 Tax=Pseudonaja textilis TaxID=8673 RepID=A0A670XN28_PSETE